MKNNVTTKSEARRRAREIRGALTGEYMKRASTQITEKVLGSREFAICERLFIYVSTAGEPDTEEIIRTALKAGKRVFVPRCTGPGTMEAVEIADFDEDLAPGTMGILEPKNGRRADPREIDLAIIPCVAAAKDGVRIGHGAGYYDRYLAETGCYKTVLCFSELIMEELPAEKYDIKADRVITDAE